MAERQFNRAHSLLESGVSSKNEVEEKKSILLEIQKKLSSAEIVLEDLKIYTPFGGIVGFFKLRKGSELNIGDRIVTLILLLCWLNLIYLFLLLNKLMMEIPFL